MQQAKDYTNHFIEPMNNRAKKAAKMAAKNSHQAAMIYRGLINIDFSKVDPNQYQQLIAALIQAGWAYVETSALVIEKDLPTVLQSLEIIAKQCADSGVLSALTIHIQGSTNFGGIGYPGVKNHKHALYNVKRKPLP